MVKKITINSWNQNKQIAELLKTKKFAVVVQTDTVMGLVSLNPKLIYEIQYQYKIYPKRIQINYVKCI